MREPEQRSSFDKATVDRWQVFGGMAGVAALALSVLGAVKDLLPLSLVVSGGVTLVGVVLLYQWGRRFAERGARGFLVPVAITVLGAVVTGVISGAGFRPAIDNALGTSNTTTTTTTTTTTSGTDVDAAGTPAAPTTTAKAARGDGAVPARFRDERITLNNSSWIDLDSTGENGGVTGDEEGNSDFGFLTGIDGKDMVVLEAEPSYQNCMAGTAITSYIEQEKVVEGLSFCLKTTSGRRAGVRVESVEPHEVLKFHVVVWEKA